MTLMFPRSLRTHFAYIRYRRKDPAGCGFCAVYKSPTDQLVSLQSTMMILKNRFPYTRWDGWKVAEHLMVVPVRHITQLDKMTVEEEDELIKIMAEYDSKGYSFYHRSHGNKSKSMPHIHGHLIKPRE